MRLPSAEARRKILAALDQVSLPASASDRFPHQLSGGQRQRVAIARALIVDPDCLICDEVTSALDVSVQAVITELLGELQRQCGLSLLFVTHNLAVVRSLAQRVYVMQRGQVVEAGPTARVLQALHSEETRRLLQDAPRFSRIPTPAPSAPLPVGSRRPVVQHSHPKPRERFAHPRVEFQLGDAETLSGCRPRAAST